MGDGVCEAIPGSFAVNIFAESICAMAKMFTMKLYRTLHWNLGVCHLTWQKGLFKSNLMILRLENYPGLSGGPSEVTGSIKINREAEEEVRMR